MSEKSCCSPGNVRNAFKIEALVTVDERGQMVLPKDLRDKLQIAPGEKLAVVSWEKDGAVCCISLLRTDTLTGMVKEYLGPLATELTA